MKRYFIKPAWPAFMALVAGGCCSMPDFNVGDMDGRLDFSGSLAFDFDFDADMEFEFDGDFSGWAGLGAATSLSLDIDIEGKIAYEQDIDIDIDDDGVDEEVRVIGFGDSPNDIDTVVTAWEGDVYTFDDGYCYVLVWDDDTVTLLTGPCEEDGPLLTCTSPADDLDDVSCEVCDEAGRCSECDGTTVSECISDGAEELSELPEPEPTETEPTETDTETASDAGAADAAMPEPSATDAGAPTATAEPDASPEPTTEEPDPTNSEAYDTCLDQLSVIEGSLSLCGLSLTLETSELCSGHLAAVDACFSSIDGLDIFDSPCNALESDDCSEVVE